MLIKNETDILDQAVRINLIKHIESDGNLARKDEAFKRYECYKDRTSKYVIHNLRRQFDADTVNEMHYAIANIALVRKCIDKLARVYKYGVERDAEGYTDQVQNVAKEIDFDSAIEKTNRYYKLFQNCLFYVCPKSDETVSEKKTVVVQPLAPFIYDVAAFADRPDLACCVILSDYEVRKSEYSSGSDREVPQLISIKQPDNSVDFMNSTAPEGLAPGADAAKKEYIFWTKNFHFTCDARGAIISEGDSTNPIMRLPFVNFAKDQDGMFWATGGSDLTDGAILVNSMISNINHIAIVQGYGQLVMTGKNLPRHIKLGPNKAVLLEVGDKDTDPAPTFEFKTANPPLDQLRSLVEMYVALLLTTNNLSTSGVASNLNGNSNFASGIAMIIDKSESLEDVEDQRQEFVDNEPVIWSIIADWMNVLKNSGELSDSLAPFMFPDDIELTLKFGQPITIETEKERLETLKLKKDLGIISMIDMIKAENPGMTDEQAEEKLLKITEEKLKRMGEFGLESNGNSGNEQQDDGQDRPGSEPTEGDQTGDRAIPSGADS